MATITTHRLRLMLIEAYRAGYHGCLDMAESFAEDSMTKLPSTPSRSANDGWKNWFVKELRMIEVGTILEHASRGKGVTCASSTERYMMWADGTISHFYKDDVPWNELMRVAGKIKLETAPPPRRRKTIGGL